MEIEELKKRKTKFENEIRNSLLQFAVETGVAVDSIRFQMWMEGKNPHCTAVAIDLDVFGE